MDMMANFTTGNWIAIAAIAIPIALAMMSSVRSWVSSLYKKYIRDRKVEVVSEVIDGRFSSLNDQIKSAPFLDKKGFVSLNAILNNHHTMFRGALDRAGKLRENEVYITCYKNNDDEGGTTITHRKETITNLLPSQEIHVTLADIISNWNKKIGKVKRYSEKEKVEFVSRFHLYFEMIHPFFDGNVRLGRMIINEQLSFLFGKIVNFAPDLKKYHEALDLAVKGDESLLRLLIQEQVQ